MNQGSVELRRSAAIRAGVAVLAAAGLTALLIAIAWKPLDIETSVVGYPIFGDFNVFNYSNGYYLLIGFFPLTALLIFLLLTRFAPRLGLALPGPRGEPFPLRALDRDEKPLAGDPPLDEAPRGRQRAVAAARVGFVGAILGLELSVAADWEWWQGIAAGIAVYALVASAAAALLRRRANRPYETAVAAVNACGTALTIAGLVLVSAGSEVLVAAEGSVEHKEWFPAWLGLPIAALAGALVAIALRRAGPAAAAARVERTTLLLVAAPVALFVVFQVLPGEPGGIDFFHGGELLAGSRLVLDGFFPWRDVVLTHGIFQDVIYSFGRGIFGDTHWGHNAGVAMVMSPLYFVSVFFLLVYLFSRNWLYLLFAGLILAEPTISTDQFRLILWPPILLLLATELRRHTALKAVALALVVVVQVALTPEAVPAIPAVALVLLFYEWSGREAGRSLRESFPRTIAVGVAGAGFALLWGIILAANGALDDYIYISRHLVSGHALSGAQPPSPNEGTISEPFFYFLALATPAALLISIAYAAYRLRTRGGFRTEDWVMAAVAIFVFLYYPKFLDRMDTGHVYQPFAVVLPLLLYIVYRVTTAAEGAIRARWGAGRLLRLTAHPVSLGLVVLVGVLAWGNLHVRVTDAAAKHRPTVTGDPAPKRAGYIADFDNEAYSDIKKVLDTYLDPDDRLFDFSNTPELFFYQLDRDPSTRYFQVSLAYPVEFQEDLIRRLREARPKLIAIDNDSDPFVGLSNFDGMPSMVHLYETSQWIFDRYKPLLWTHGITFYARRDMPPPEAAGLDLKEKPATHQIPFSIQPCQWGYIPNFLSGPGLPPADARGEEAQTRVIPDQATVIGWAGDPRAELPAREVVGVVEGEVVSRVKPDIRRPDLISFGLPEGFNRAGFQMQAPVQRGETLQVYAVSRDGRLTEIVAEGEKPEKGTVEVDGREVDIDPQAVYGQINSEVKTRATTLRPPPGSDWDDYRWLEIDAGEEGFNDGTFTVYDRPDRPSIDREIVFKTLPGDRGEGRYVVPVGSCSQWHAYPAKRLFLNSDVPQDVTAVRLIR
jgi:hypothetical protein